MELKEEFKNEFEKCCELIDCRYNKEDNRNIVGVILNNFLHSLQVDIETLDFIAFHQKYLKGYNYLDYNDFTNKQILEIINESPLNERDKQLATMYWVENATEDVISSKLQIDRKTARANIPKISCILKKTASKIYK